LLFTSDCLKNPRQDFRRHRCRPDARVKKRHDIAFFLIHAPAGGTQRCVLNEGCYGGAVQPSIDRFGDSFLKLSTIHTLPGTVSNSSMFLLRVHQSPGTSPRSRA